MKGIEPMNEGQESPGVVAEKLPRRGPGRPPKDRTEIAPVQKGEIVWNEEKKALLKSLIIASDKGGSAPSDTELSLAIHICQRTGLDPFIKQIYFIKYGGKLTPQTSVDGFRLLSQRTGDCAGTDPIEYGPTDASGRPEWAKFTVYRIVKGMRVPFTAIARWKEYYTQPSPIAAKMPFLMLGKCAESLARRMAFPAELSGLYTPEEMEQAENGGRNGGGETQIIDVPAKVTPLTPPAPEAPKQAAPPKPQAPTPLPPPQQPPAPKPVQAAAPAANGGIKPETQKELSTALGQKINSNDVAKLRKALKDLTGVDRSLLLTEEGARNHIDALNQLGVEQDDAGVWKYKALAPEAQAEEGV